MFTREWSLNGKHLLWQDKDNWQTEIKSQPMWHQIQHVNSLLISSERNNKEKRQEDA